MKTDPPDSIMTRELASDYLSRVGINDDSLIDIYLSCGGTHLGLELLKRANVPGLTLPCDLTLDLGQIAAGASTIIQNLPDALRRGFALKYSGYRESFFPFCIRGQYTSRHRFWDGTDVTQAQTLISDATVDVPFGTRAVVLQEYIKAEHLSGVFYAYGYRDRTLIEAVSRGRRTFSELRAAQIIRSATIIAPHIKSVSTREANPFELHYIIEGLRDVVGFDLDIEGFESAAGVIAVQLRPIPNDMPQHITDTPLAAQLKSSASWYQTPLVWGSWLHGPALVGSDIPGAPAIMTKATPTLEQCPDIMRRLQRGDPTLVVDLVDGFRLSHDPCYLPETIRHRQGYAYISVAGSPLETLKSGERIEALIDGELGIIRRLP